MRRLRHVVEAVLQMSVCGYWGTALPDKGTRARAQGSPSMSVSPPMGTVLQHLQVLERGSITSPSQVGPRGPSRRQSAYDRTKASPSRPVWPAFPCRPGHCSQWGHQRGSLSTLRAGLGLGGSPALLPPAALGFITLLCWDFPPEVKVLLPQILFP